MYLFLVVWSSLTTVAVAVVVGNTVHYDLVFDRRVVRPDGVARAAVTVNGQLPGPPLVAFVGDTVVVNVTNMAFEEEAFTIHWHGVSGIKNAWHDGSSVTNCPIPHGTSFLQTFTALSEGTHYYHAHTGSIRAEGTYGAVIFKSRTPKHHYDDELSLILSDWYHQSVTELTAGLRSNPFKWVFHGDSILMNGKGLSKQCSDDEVFTNTTTQVTYSDGTVRNMTFSCRGQRERFIVEPGKTYLLRLINAASLGYYSFSIAGHSLTIVGTGTSPTVPNVVKSVELSAGQRLEVLVTFDQHILDPDSPQNAYSFLMQVQSDYRGPDPSHAGIANGYVTYANTSTTVGDLNFDSVSPILPEHDNRPWDSWHPLLKQESSHSEFKPPPQTATASHLFITRQEWVDSATGKGFESPMITPTVGDDTISLAWTMNRQRLVMPRTPFLLSSYINQEVVQNPSILRLKVGDVIDITMQNTVAGNGVCETHPWHIHDAPAWLIGEGPGAFNSSVDPLHYNLNDPPLLDTVTNFASVHSARRNSTFESGDWQTPCGWFTIRIQATRPGMWFFHCHIDWHMTMGMGMVFDVESETVEQYPADMPLCGEAVAFDVLRSGRSEDDNDSFTHHDVVVIVVTTFLVTIATVAVVFLAHKHFTKSSAKNSGHRMADITDSPLQNEDRHL